MSRKLSAKPMNSEPRISDAATLNFEKCLECSTWTTSQPKANIPKKRNISAKYKNDDSTVNWSIFETSLVCMSATHVFI